MASVRGGGQVDLRFAALRSHHSPTVPKCGISWPAVEIWAEGVGVKFRLVPFKARTKNQNGLHMGFPPCALYNLSGDPPRSMISGPSPCITDRLGPFFCGIKPLKDPNWYKETVTKVEESGDLEEKCPIRVVFCYFSRVEMEMFVKTQQKWGTKLLYCP